MSPVQQLLAIWVAASIVMLLGWARQTITRNAGIVDVLWSYGIGSGAIFIAWTTPGDPAQRVLIALLGGTWGLRLGTHLMLRNRGQPEDGRYASLRQHWNGSAWRFALVFQAQAALVALFCVPFIAASRARPASLALDLVAVFWWLLSVAGEAAADRQLERFRRDGRNRGSVCRDGWWGRCRHPNYFFECLHWFAYVALSLTSAWWVAALAGPALMYVFVRHVSGVPYTEAQALRSRGEAYRRYQAQVPEFFPRFMKQDADPSRSTA